MANPAKHPCSRAALLKVERLFLNQREFETARLCPREARWPASIGQRLPGFERACSSKIALSPAVPAELLYWSRECLWLEGKSPSRMTLSHAGDRSISFAPRITGEDARLNLAVCYAQLGDIRKAIAMLEPLVTSPRLAAAASKKPCHPAGNRLLMNCSLPRPAL